MASYNEIVISRDVLIGLVNSCISDLGVLENFSKTRIQARTMGCFYHAVCEVTDRFADAIGILSSSMANDWQAISFAIQGFISFDEFMGDKFKKNPNIKESDYAYQIPNMPWDAKQSHEVKSYLGIEFADEFFRDGSRHYKYGLSVYDDQLERLNSVITELLRYNIYAMSYCRRLNAFLDTDQFRGNLADAVKNYLRNYHYDIILRTTDMTNSLIHLIRRYQCRYRNIYGNETYIIDKEDFERYRDKLYPFAEYWIELMNTTNLYIQMFNELAEDGAKLQKFTFDPMNYTQNVYRSLTSEYETVCDIEDQFRGELVSYLHDVTRIVNFVYKISPNTGFNMLKADSVSSVGLLNSLETGRQKRNLAFYSDLMFEEDGRADLKMLQKYVDYLKENGKYSNIVDDFSGLSADTVQGMGKYYLALKEQGIDGIGAAEIALDKAIEEPLWLETLNRAGEGYCGYLSKPENFVAAVETKPESITERIPGIMKEFYLDVYEKYDEMAAVDAYEKTGLKIREEDVDLSPSNVRSALIRHGFACKPLNSFEDDTGLKPGDLIISGYENDSDSTVIEVYVGDGRTVRPTDNPENLEEYLKEYNDRYGTHYDKDYMYDANGYYVVSEDLAAGRVSVADITNNDTKVIAPSDYDWRFVYRYTAGVPMS